MRSYIISFSNVAVSAAQDLIAAFGSAQNYAEVTRVWVACTDTTPPAAQELALRVQHLPATVTQGSGGSTPTPQPLDVGDTAAKTTAHANDTTGSTTSGTATTLLGNGCEVRQGLDYSFPVPVPLMNGEAVAFQLLGAPNGTIHLSGGMVVNERGKAT